MCKSLVLCLLTLASTGYAGEPPAGPAQPSEKRAANRIVSVTVYQNNALVTRDVDVPEGTGSMELIVTPLPPGVANSSLYSEGTDGIRILSTRYRIRPIKEDTREEVRKLEAQIKEFASAAQKLQSDVRTIEQNLQLLSKLENFTSASTHAATEKGTLNSEATITLSKYVMDQRTQKSKELVTLQEQIRVNGEEAAFAQRKLQELTAGSSRTENDAVIIVDKKNAAAGKVRLNYLVENAFWRPQYKLRATSKSKDPVQLEYLAAITQQSGEDWSNANLILSTAEPMLNAAPPDLKTLELTVIGRGGLRQPMAGQGGQADGHVPYAGQSLDVVQQQAKSLRGKAQHEFNRNNEMGGNTSYNNAAALEQARDLLAPREELFAGKGRHPLGGDEGPSVTYHLRSKYTIPSRHEEQVIEVARIEMTPDYYYKAVPVLTPHVYRLANLTNKSEYVLLPGEATMYLGTDFVGRMNLPLVAIGEQFTAGFGVDPQLQVQRQLMDKSRTTQGGNQVLKYDYRILISSYKAEPVKLQVWDRLPRAENETAGVSLIKATPEVSADSLYVREQRPNNLLRWDLTVEPAMNGEKALGIRYEFKVELDRQMLISNVLTK
ncbi:MAG TPA: mucoidy inhibitor MuiA family protein [Gemmataceae bacterium]|nr:mucoidy inhibitor MuiA family protein [Gemmataceae bacterium]